MCASIESVKQQKTSKVRELLSSSSAATFPVSVEAFSAYASTKKTSNITLKRKASTEDTEKQVKRAKTHRNFLKSIASLLDSMADSESPSKEIFSSDGLQEWCMEKAKEKIEEYVSNKKKT